MPISRPPFRLFAFLLIGLGFSSSLSAQNTLDLHDKRVLILGDSITNKGTYVSFVSYFLQKGNPNLNYDIISIGLGSETAAGTSERDHPYPRPCIHSRIDSALTQIEPEIVFACYGMNDGIYHPLSADRFLDYQDGIKSLVEKIVAANAEVVLLTPPLFDAGAKKALAAEGASEFSYKLPYSKYNDVLRTYSKWILLADLSTVSKIDLNTPMLEYNNARRSSNPNFHLSADGIHPGDLGHLLIAKTILESLDVFLDGDVVALLASAKADPLFAEIDQRRQMRSKAWLEFIGYDRGKKVKTDSVDEIEAEAAKLQRSIDELRRK